MPTVSAAPKITTLGTFTGHAYTCSMVDDLSGAGCGGGLPRIVYSRKGALDSAISRRRLEYSLA